MSSRRKQRAYTGQQSATPLVPRWLLGEQTAALLSSAFLVIMSVVSFTYHKIGDYGVETDFYWAYVPHAKQILQGNVEIDPFKGPGYELVLALTESLTGDFFRAGLIISLVSASVVLFLTYRLLAKLFNNEAAFVVSIALATNFVFLVSSYTAATDMFFNMLAVMVLYMLLRSGQFRLWELAVAGVITGFAYITRYNGISFFIAVTLGLLLLNYKNVEWKQRLVGTALFFGAAALFVVPWGIYCLQEKGKFFYNQNHLNIAYEMFGKGKMGWDEYWHNLSGQFNSYVEVIAYAPGTFFNQIAFNAVDHFWKDISLLVGLPVGIFAFGGIVALIVQRLDRRQAAYFLFGATFYVVLLPIFYGERFSLYLAPLLMLLSVSFFQWRKVPSIGFSGFGLKHIVLLGALVISARSSIDRVAEAIDFGPTEILRVRDEFVLSHGRMSGESSIVARKPHIAYYLDMKFIPFPYVNTIEELLEESRKAGADYLFYSGIETGMRPQFRFLLDPRHAPNVFKPVVQVYNPPAVLYELSPE